MSLWSNYWSQTAIVNVYDGYDDHGNAKYNPPRSEVGISVPCRVEYESKEIINAQGDTVTSTAIMFCDDVIPPLSIVKVDDQQFVVQSCAPCRGLDGTIDHIEIRL